jgi:hypothetical protein
VGLVEKDRDGEDGQSGDELETVAHEDCV